MAAHPEPSVFPSYSFPGLAEGTCKPPFVKNAVIASFKIEPAYADDAGLLSFSVVLWLGLDFSVRAHAVVPRDRSRPASVPVSMFRLNPPKQVAGQVHLSDGGGSRMRQPQSMYIPFTQRSSKSTKAATPALVLGGLVRGGEVCAGSLLVPACVPSPEAPMNRRMGASDGKLPLNS